MITRKWEKQAEDLALSRLSSIFSHPNRLDKLDMLRKAAHSKKIATGAMLRTGVQAQLNGVRFVVAQLLDVNENIQTIALTAQEIFDQLEPMSRMKTSVEKIRTAIKIFDQYALAMEILPWILNISEIVASTRRFISEGKLLHAHQNIMKLERIWNNLLAEVHRSKTNMESRDVNILNNYFADLNPLIDEFSQQIWHICSKAFKTVDEDENGPEQLVTALRIIDREERIDQEYLRNQSTTNFIPPNRPRSWYSNLIEVLVHEIEERIERIPVEDRSENKEWLSNYLEMCRKTVIDDLIFVKQFLVACFPPQYNIYDVYTHLYHEVICQRLREIPFMSLEKDEILQCLNWIKAYGGKNMFGSPVLENKNAAQLHDHLLGQMSTKKLIERLIEIEKNDKFLAFLYNRNWYKEFSTFYKIAVLILIVAIIVGFVMIKWKIFD